MTPADKLQTGAAVFLVAAVSARLLGVSGFYSVGLGSAAFVVSQLGLNKQGQPVTDQVNGYPWETTYIRA